MNANVIKSNKLPIPAGLIGEGIEAFWFEGEKWVNCQGACYRYNDAPTHAKAAIQHEFQNDRRSLTYMAKHMGLKYAGEMFDTWYRCIVGGIDDIPDFGVGKFTPDTFNNLCTKAECEHRGKFCGRESGIGIRELETIRHLKQGKNFEQAAADSYITIYGLKSRVEKLREMFGAANTTELISITSKFGI